MDLGGLPVGDVLKVGGGWAFGLGVLWFVARKVISGDLVPRRTHEDVIRDRDEWRRVVETQADRLDTLSTGMTQVADGQRAVEQFVRALPRARGGR
jgi:hypothetical protein